MRWIKRGLVAVLVLLALALAGFWTFAPAFVEKARNPVAPHDPYPVSAGAKALHGSLLLGDLHADPLLWSRDLNKRGTRGQVDVPRLIEGNVALQVFTAVTKSPAGQNYDENSDDAFDNITLLAFGQLWPIETWSSIFKRGMYQAAKLHRFASESEGRLRVITSGAALEQLLADRAAGQELVGGILGLEGLHPLEGDMSKLDPLFEAGHRVFGLQHFFDNELGGSLHGLGNKGLTEFGRQVVAELDSRAAVIDVAHSSHRVIEDVLEIVKHPIILSHTGIYAHCQVKRNVPGDLMRKIAAQGGVIGMGYWADVTCGPIDPDGIAAMIVTGVNEIGEDAIALGSDFDGSVGTGFDTSELAALTDALLRAGLTESQIRKIMGENMLRVFRARLGTSS